MNAPTIMPCAQTGAVFLWCCMMDGVTQLFRFETRRCVRHISTRCSSMAIARLPLRIKVAPSLFPFAHLANPPLPRVTKVAFEVLARN